MVVAGWMSLVTKLIGLMLMLSIVEVVTKFCGTGGETLVTTGMSCGLTVLLMFETSFITGAPKCVDLVKVLCSILGALVRISGCGIITEAATTGATNDTGVACTTGS